jgi:gluconate 2-dehydrogenase gamma chain
MIKNQEHSEVNQERITNWQLSRSEFLKSLVVLSVSSQLIACKEPVGMPENEEVKITSVMSNQQANIIKKVQSILFPNDGNGPSVEEINAFPYLLWYLQDELIEKYERDFFIRGADWVNQEALTITNIPFLELSIEIQSKMVGLLAKKKKTKIWLSKLLTSIFEALLSEPSYGGNPEGIGWKWLSHDPGTPRPEEKNSYPNILKTIRNEV